jgi:hypothetical protein
MTAKKPSPKSRKPEAVTSRKMQKNADSTGPVDFCGVRLTPMRREFVVKYVTPGLPTFHNALRSALEAGYKGVSAKAGIYRLLPTSRTPSNRTSASPTKPFTNRRCGRLS